MDAAVELVLEQKPAVGYWGVAGARPCDACAAEPARLHCRADGAFLCPGCDARAHGAGSRHARVWLCEVCEHAPAAVTCRADAAALCAACDADIHSANPLARRHERLPVAPFFGALADQDDAADDEEEMREAFKVFDVDGDGFISAAELQEVLKKLGLPEASSMANVKEMICNVDRDRDGRVDFSEFKCMMQGITVWGA